MTNTDGERFDVFSASGEYIKQVGSFMEIRDIIDKRPNVLFDSGDEEATIRGIHTNFEMRFNQNFQPQDGRSVWVKYNNFPGSW